MKRFVKCFLTLGLLMMMAIGLIGCSSGEQQTKFTADTPLSELNDPNYKVGVFTGTIMDQYAAQVMPNAEKAYANSTSDLTQMLKQGKIDYFLMEEPIARVIMNENPEISVLNAPIDDVDYGLATAKTVEGTALNEKLSDFVRSLKASGELKKIDEKWFSKDDSLKHIDIDLTGTKGEVRMAADLTMVPFVYMSGNEPVGYEIEIVKRYCEQEGLSFHFSNVPGASGLAGLGSKYDICGGCLTITEERQQTVNFTEPTYTGAVRVMIMGGSGGSENFLEGIVRSFKRNFIEEDRWKLMLKGAETTLMITLFSGLFGTLLGYLLFMVCRRGNKIALKVAGFFSWLMQGMPVVVLLLILFYVVFASSSIEGAWVSVIAFTMVTGADIYGMLCTGVNAIDPGQMEGALALGCTYNQAFNQIVFPQAVKNMLPSYRGELISLVKSTSVVGYIAVEDLTKMSDIIRSRTFEALFPLIVTAIVYFILGWLLTKLVNFVTRKIDTESRTKEEILKGIQCDL